MTDEEALCARIDLSKRLVAAIRDLEYAQAAFSEARVEYVDATDRLSAAKILVQTLSAQLEALRTAYPPK